MDYFNNNFTSDDDYDGDYIDNGNGSFNVGLSKFDAPARAIQITSVVIYTLVFLLGVPGNAFVLWMAGLKMKRTVNVVWFITLAAADFLCCLSIPFSVSDALLENRWPYGDAMCKVIPAFVVLNMFASVFTLVLISLDRLVLVVWPVWAQNHRSLTLAWLLCGLAWVLALLLSLPSMLLRATETDPGTNISYCTYSIGDGDSVSASLFASMQMVRFLLGFLVPLLLILTCYTLITLKVRQSSFHAGRAFKIIVAVVVAFFVCWLPYHAVGLAKEYGHHEEVVDLMDHLSVALACVNSCLNPLLYVFMGQDFKQKVRLSLRRILEKAFSEDHTYSSPHSKFSHSRMTASSEAHV